MYTVNQTALFGESIVITISQNKGGAGKTSLLINLAGVLSKLKKRVLIIDLDGQGNIDESFGLTKNPRRSMYNVLKGESALSTVIVQYNEFIHIAQAGKAMSSIEFDILPNIKKYDNPFALLTQNINLNREKYDFILIDTPPSMGLITGNAFFATDYVLIPFVPEDYCINGLKRTLEAIEDFQKMGMSVDVLAIVPMLVDLRTSLHSGLLQQARQYCETNDILITDTVIKRSIRFADAIAKESKPATLGRDANKEIVRDYNDLWNEIAEKLKLKGDTNNGELHRSS